MIDVETLDLFRTVDAYYSDTGTLVCNAIDNPALYRIISESNSAQYGKGVIFARVVQTEEDKFETRNQIVGNNEVLLLIRELIDENKKLKSDLEDALC